MLHNNIKKKTIFINKEKNFKILKKNIVKYIKGGNKTQICIQRKKKKFSRKQPPLSLEEKFLQQQQ